MLRYCRVVFASRVPFLPRAWDLRAAGARHAPARPEDDLGLLDEFIDRYFTYLKGILGLGEIARTGTGFVPNAAGPAASAGLSPSGAGPGAGTATSPARGMASERGGRRSMRPDIAPSRTIFVCCFVVCVRGVPSPKFGR